MHHARNETRKTKEYSPYKLEIMNRKQFKKKRYVSPSIAVIHNPFDGQPLLNAFSNSGGHTKAGDDGNDINDAKRGGYYDDFEDEEEETPQPWGLQ